MDYQSLSQRQRAILTFIRQWSDEHGYPPTIREIGEAVGINSTSVVNYNLNKLVKEGFITRSKDVSRGIRVVGNGDEKTMRSNFMLVPMVGQIVAGKPAPPPGDGFRHYYDAEAGLPIPPDPIGSPDPPECYPRTASRFPRLDSQ